MSFDPLCDNEATGRTLNSIWDANLMQGVAYIRIYYRTGTCERLFRRFIRVMKLSD
jgi:hypothetical protein